MNIYDAIAPLNSRLNLDGSLRLDARAGKPHRYDVKFCVQVAREDGEVRIERGSRGYSRQTHRIAVWEPDIACSLFLVQTALSHR
jgi:hypothetical protein